MSLQLTCSLNSNSTSVSKSCPLYCHLGTCQITSTGPKCICPPLYEGARCQVYRCSQYCKNKGMCYFDHLSLLPASIPPLKVRNIHVKNFSRYISEFSGTIYQERKKCLKLCILFQCNCPPQWTGERCETPVRLCDGRCYNGGSCSTRLGFPKCNCPPGFTGSKCENCLQLTCQNGGICSKNEIGIEVCRCQPGYLGAKCEKSQCDNYCKNNGTCSLNSVAGPQCSCSVGYNGKKCEQDACKDHCKNGGKFKHRIAFNHI